MNVYEVALVLDMKAHEHDMKLVLQSHHINYGTRCDNLEALYFKQTNGANIDMVEEMKDAFTDLLLVTLKRKYQPPKYRKDISLILVMVRNKYYTTKDSIRRC